MCDTYDYLKHSTFRFNLIDFQLNTDFPSQFCVFYRKITKEVMESDGDTHDDNGIRNSSEREQHQMGGYHLMAIFHNRLLLKCVVKRKYCVLEHGM